MLKNKLITKHFNELYYDIMAFYYYEPQHLGKKKNPDNRFNTYNKVMDHIMEMEVSLNHILSIFFFLAPASSLDRFFQKVLVDCPTDSYIDDSDFVSEIGDATQPDFLFVGSKQIVALEMKVGAKSSLEQLMKYLLLNIIYQEKKKTKLPFKLIFLGQGDFKDLWEEVFPNVAQLKKAFKKYSFPAITKKGNIKLKKYEAKIRHLVEECQIEFINYKDFSRILLDEQKHNKNEIYAKLLAGIISELRERKMIDAN